MSRRPIRPIPIRAFFPYILGDATDLEKCIRLCRKEMAELCEVPLGQMQLKKAKAQMTGQMTLASENYENMMLSIGKSFLIYGKVDGLDTICDEVEAIGPDLLQQVARDILAPEKQTILIYK